MGTRAESHGGDGAALAGAGKRTILTAFPGLLPDTNSPQHRNTTMLRMPALVLGALTWAALVLPAGAVAQTKPPCKVGDVVRAGALNYDAKILEYSAAKGLYRVRYVKGYVGDEEWVPARGLKTCQGIEPEPVALSYFFGRWELTLGGGAYARQAEAPPLRIRDDGSYTWVLGKGKEIDGEWRPAKPQELKSGYDKLGTTIVLYEGEGGKNWLVTRFVTLGSDGADRIQIERADLGLTYRGVRSR